MTDKEYKYKRPIGYYFYFILLIILIGLYGYNLIKILLSLFENFQERTFVGFLVVGLLILGIIYILIMVVKMFIQYDKTDHDKEIIVKNNDRLMLIRQNKNERIIRNEDIDTVEIFEPSTSGYPIAYFSFIRINLKLGEKIVITCFTLPLGEFDLEKVLKGKKRIRKWKLFNEIK